MDKIINKCCECGVVTSILDSEGGSTGVIPNSGYCHKHKIEMLRIIFDQKLSRVIMGMKAQ